MRKFIVVFALTLLICACVSTQGGKERVDELASSNFNSVAKIHCLNRTALSEETQVDFRVKVLQKKDDPLRVCYRISEFERCFNTRLDYTYTECRETTPPYKRCHDDRFDGNEVWKIYHIGAGDTLMLGNDTFIAITGEEFCREHRKEALERKVRERCSGSRRERGTYQACNPAGHHREERKGSRRTEVDCFVTAAPARRLESVIEKRCSQTEHLFWYKLSDYLI
jgi:hypothetical protein